MRAARIPCLLLLLVGGAAAADTLEIFGHKWLVPMAADWSIGKEDSLPILHLLVGREPLPGPRRPFQFAVADTLPFRQVTLEAGAKPLKRSLIIVFAYQDAAHFDYAHFSSDEASKIAVHNGVFHVYGGERVRISALDGPASFSGGQRWYHLKLVWSGGSGEVQGFVDGNAIPGLHAVDLSLSQGRVGLGSFDETGDFRNVTINGVN
jgi:hypothetical protein